MTGIVFNIQGYSLHDGPGIRTVVFLKGCPLRCLWCSNPESQRCAPEPAFDKQKCAYEKGCRWCSAVSFSGTDAKAVLGAGAERCLKDAKLCPSGALRIYGKEMTAEEVAEAAAREQAFYRHGKGGITLSGGEPMMQPEFAVEILRESKKRRIHTAMETSGFCSWEALKAAAALLDHIYYDIKLFSEEKHLQYTGVSNALILENLRRLTETFPALSLRVRTPVIPSVNDNAEEIRAIREFVRSLGLEPPELLPYHRFGEKKYEMLGRPVPALPERLDQNTFAELKTI